ncbi:hypothetical protein TPHA_0F02050 [Tetrapisispora phaffii CBS 4417]|uniref:mRNA stability protein n=1 Tax=Tetrapisispora phaffii (strain ATCC 24235 / CBS 4417 / NBRC 1672 / NRRL Y-8282 / UCD 70-5) TaxID=1071381 RepID=G8BVA5_TETPH|nr:hypothetical protein TPHA_0F02050 [Tetrapisispora phaffii CBS 4417]CCE63687.1 hypothetical protein TPHA_0F02050 [Tetrapisispora phaffii CBS 4417]
MNPTTFNDTGISPTNSSENLKNAEADGVPLSKLTPEELKLYKLYGKLPSKRDLFKHNMQERKYFDSGDYALKKAGLLHKDDMNSNLNSTNTLPVTNPSGLRESIIRRRMSTSTGTDNDTVARQGSISSGPPPKSPNK